MVLPMVLEGFNRAAWNPINAQMTAFDPSVMLLSGGQLSEFDGYRVPCARCPAQASTYGRVHAFEIASQDIATTARQDIIKLNIPNQFARMLLKRRLIGEIQVETRFRLCRRLVDCAGGDAVEAHR